MNNPTTGKYDTLKDAQLMEAVRIGDSAAFNVLYHRYSKRLLYYFYRMLGNCPEKSQDFLQDIFLKIIERPESFDPLRSFSTWIFSVAHNMCKNEYRRIAVRSNTLRESDCDQYSEITETELSELKITADQIFEQINELGENEKTTFLLYYREDFPIHEIGKVLCIPEGTVKSKLYYARKKILAKLQVTEIKR
jgi:RNA polymerase sigma-70 factor (ECF subfamily)